jgi:hypothetical protein
MPTDETDHTNGHDLEQESPLDRESIEADIRAGAKALNELVHHAQDDWNRWDAVIQGWRGLRSLAFEKAQTSNVMSQAYRDAMGDLLRLKKYAVYDQIDRPTRSVMSRMCDQIEEITLWVAALPAEDKLRWKHPQAVAKHCPPHLLAGGKGGNKPPRKMKVGKKKTSTLEEDRLRQVLILVINEFVAPVNPQRAAELLKLLYPATNPNDSIDGLLAPADDQAEDGDSDRAIDF